MTEPLREERGAVLPLVALSLLLLIGLAAIVIDIGFGRQVRRQAQSAVDAGSLAAVIDYDGTIATEGAATARAIEYVEDNGFTTANSNIAVSFSINVAGDPCVRVVVSNHAVPTTFGRVLGWSQINIGAASTGCRSPGNITLPGLFSGGTCSGSGKGFVLSGNDNEIVGSIHSNYDAKESGNNNERIGGTATYVNSPVDISGSGLHWWTGASMTSTVPWPITFNMIDFAPGGSRALAAGANYFSFTGDRTGSGPVAPGIYYTTGKWELTGVSAPPVGGVSGATFVSSGGVIELKGNVNLRPFSGIPEKLTFFAGWQEPGKQSPVTARCDSETMKVSGNCNNFDGIAYVPFGKYTASGEGNGHDRAGGSCGASPSNTYAGGVIAWALNVNGNFNLYRGGTVPAGAGSPYLSD